MAGESIVAFVEEWQTGFFLVLGVAAIGVLVGLAARSVAGPPGFFFGFLGGAVGAFVLYAYLRYGR